MLRARLIKVARSNSMLYAFIKRFSGRSRTLVKNPSSMESKVQEFVRLFRLSNYRSAAGVCDSIPAEMLGFSDKIRAIKCLYGAGRGVEADDRLRKLINSSGIYRKQNRKVLQVAECLRISGLVQVERIGALESLTRAMDEQCESYDGVLFRLSVVRFKLLESEGGLVDPLDIILSFSRPDALLVDYSEAFPILVAYGHHSKVYDCLLKGVEAGQLLNRRQIELICRYFPEWVNDNEEFFQRSVLKCELGISALRALYEHRTVSAAIQVQYDSVFSELVTQFSSFDIFGKDAFLKFLMNFDYWGLAGRLASELDVSSGSLQALNARGFSYLIQEDVGASYDCFSRVLFENPSDNLASNGLRFVLPRLGRSADAILEFRAQIGYGLKSAGRLSIRKGSEYTTSAMMVGQYCSALVSKRNSRGWKMLEALLGQAFYNYKPLPISSTGRMFLVADEGVGDEIRSAQFYSFLLGSFDEVCATCDPRLKAIFERSFPGIDFYPIKRTRKQTSTREETKSSRLVGFDEQVSKYLDSNVLEQLQRFEHVTFAQNLMFNYFSGKYTRRQGGAYLVWDRSPRISPSAGKLKIGILWRSHLMVGMRKLMYLRVEDFAPLTQIEGVEIWSIQHAMTEAETQTCRELGINLLDDVDLFNDFEGMAGCLLGLDLLIGISSVPMELGAALGVETWMLGFSSENYYLRTAGGKTEVDQLTLNSTVIAPPWIDFTEPQEVCVREVFEEVKRRLAPKLAALADASSRVCEG